MMTPISIEKNTREVDITLTPPSKAEIDKLIVGINNSPGFNNFIQKELQQYSQNNELRSLRLKTKLVGITAINQINQQWAELAVFFVFKQYRGRGLGKTLWDNTLDSISQKNLFLVTANRRVKRLAREYGFNRKKFYELPLVVLKHFAVKRLKHRKISGFIKKIKNKQVKFGDFVFYVHKNK